VLLCPGGSCTAVVVGAALVVVDGTTTTGALVVVGGTTITGALVVVGSGMTLVTITVGGTKTEVTLGPTGTAPVWLAAGGAGMPGTPRQAPNSDLQPAPQKSRLEPHQKNCEQQGP